MITPSIVSIDGVNTPPNVPKPAPELTGCFFNVFFTRWSHKLNDNKLTYRLSYMIKASESLMSS